jgi:hypothetical protein
MVTMIWTFWYTANSAFTTTNQETNITDTSWLRYMLHVSSEAGPHSSNCSGAGGEEAAFGGRQRRPKIRKLPSKHGKSAKDAW